jgi:hypothetical protein
MGVVAGHDHDCIVSYVTARPTRDLIVTER